MHLPDRDIGRLTLEQFDALLKRRRMEENVTRLNAGIVAAAILNAFRAEGTDYVNPLSFVPDWKDQVKNGPQDLRDLTPEEQKNYLMSMFMGAGKRSMK